MRRPFSRRAAAPPARAKPYSCPIIALAFGERRPRANGRNHHTLSTGETPNEPPLVHLVGAGPGDPGLLTLKALRVLREADVVHGGCLGPNPAILEHCPQAQLVRVGKRGAAALLPQDFINPPECCATPARAAGWCVLEGR